jgi:carbamoyltransferase
MKNSIFLCAVSFNWHDSSVSFSINHQVALVVEAERYFGQKRKLCTAAEMETLITFGASSLGLHADDIVGWAVTALNCPWLSDQQKAAVAERDWFWDIVSVLGRPRRCLIVSHHYAHASAFFVSGFDRAVVQTCDGGGDFGECVAAFVGDGLSLERVSHPADAANGLPYHVIAGHFYRERFCEGKLMALAAYGTPSDAHSTAIDELWPAMNRWYELEPEKRDDLLQRSLVPLYPAGDPFGTETRNLAASLQRSFELRRTSDLAALIAQHGCTNLVLAGGVCLNLGANSSIWRDVTQSLFIPPNCDDTGQSFGALCKLVTLVCGVRPSAALPFLGLGNEKIALDQIDEVAELICKGAILFVHNGKGELGPRALGHRSMIVRADSLDKKIELSERIKRREPYRPVAPITTIEGAREQFSGPPLSPFMLFSHQVRPDFRDRLAGGTHVDGSARVQTVSRDTDPFMHGLLERCNSELGVPTLLNTSLNFSGAPLANDIGLTLSMANSCRLKGHAVAVVYDGRLL